MKKLILAGFFSLLLPKTTMAQTPDFDFNEMEYTPHQTTFQLFAPSKAKGVKVRIYKEGTGGKALKTVAMKRTEQPDVWTAIVKGDLMGKFYTFDTGLGETPGVFAKAVGVNGRRGAIIDAEKTFPDDWCCDQHPVIKSPADLVVYEMHHRDFSIARKDAQYPGKFLALTEPWAIEHLKALGVNAIHILPSYDYGSVDETKLDTPQYNWGYDPVNYNVPEGSYATDPYDPVCRLREFKQMVQALHKAGIAVILDVVYNHTYDIDHSNFQLTYPDYYYRVGSNGSGCGNETASEQPMMRRFMIESVKHWYNEYRVDGFRFDLMGVHDIGTMNQIRTELSKLNPSIFIYGEGWSAGQCALPAEQLGTKANIGRMPGIAAFSDELRDALRGPFSDDTKPGWLGLASAGGSDAGLAELKESVKAGIAGMAEHPQVDYSLVNYSKQPYALQPTQMMAYVSCHDDMCLTDRLCASISELKGLDICKPAIAICNSAKYQSQVSTLIKLDLLAQTAVFTSQGVPFMLCGEELLRTKQGVHNSYESPDSINQLDWTGKSRYPQVFDYYRGLIALRRHHPAFRLGDAELVRRHLEFIPSADCLVVFTLKDKAGGDEWQDIIVALNASREEQTVDVPRGDYTVVCDEGLIDESGLRRISGDRLTVAPMSALIAHN
mgnify:CR=1 FL=1